MEAAGEVAIFCGWPRWWGGPCTSSEMAMRRSDAGYIVPGILEVLVVGRVLRSVCGYQSHATERYLYPTRCSVFPVGRVEQPVAQL